jgi:hypothetical protein
MAARIRKDRRTQDEIDEACLNFNPFEGDRDCNIRELSDQMVVGRKDYECQICNEPIAKGERHRAKVEISYDDRRAMTFRFCSLCCKAMAGIWTDDGRGIDERYAIGERKRRPYLAELDNKADA